MFRSFSSESKLQFIECISYKVGTSTMFFFFVFTPYSMKVNFTAETSAHEKCCQCTQASLISIFSVLYIKINNKKYINILHLFFIWNPHFHCLETDHIPQIYLSIKNGFPFQNANYFRESRGTLVFASLSSCFQVQK